MAPMGPLHGTPWVVCVALLLLHYSCEGLQLVAPSSQTAFFESSVVLPCTFRVKIPPINSQFLAVLWYFGDKELLRFDNKEKFINPGMSFDEHQARQGNASLTITRVTISSQGTYKCLVIYSPEKQQREIQLNVQAPPMVQIHKRALDKHRKTQLHCSITDFFPEDIRVTWLINGQVLYGSELGETKKNADGTYRVNSSVVVSPVQIQNHQVIACEVEHASLQSAIRDSLTIIYGEAPKVRLTSMVTADGNEQIYICEARGFSPEPLSIDWVVDGKKAELSRRDVDGVFNRNIYYWVNLKEDKPPPQISCSVQHETLPGPVTESIKVRQFNECLRNCHHGITALFAILFTAAVVLILSFYYLQKKHEYNVTLCFNVSHIHPEQRWTEEKVILSCMASECPRAVGVIWTVTEDQQSPTEVSDGQKNKDEEKDPLLHSNYTVKNYRTETNGRHNVTSMLSFKPDAQQHKNMEVKCKFTCGGNSIERTLKSSFYSCKKPETDIDNPIKVSLDDSGDVVCSISLQQFYPKYITIKWSYGHDQLQEAQSNEEMTQNPNSTYSSVSQCKVPGPLFQNPQFRVRVVWSIHSVHESREISVKDLPWCPVMEDIKVPSLIHAREASFQCRIYGFFPQNLGVKWFWKEAGKPELYEVCLNEKCKIAVMEDVQQPDKTFSCTTTLVKELSKADEGLEYICKVTHPSLEKALEKSTGGLTVTGGKPVVQSTLQDGGYLYLILGGFYTPDILVTWQITKEKHGEYVNMKEQQVQNNLTASGDGGFSLTSKCKGTKFLEKRYYKATIQHRALNCPEEMLFLRQKGKWYSRDSDGKKTLLPERKNEDKRKVPQIAKEYPEVTKQDKTDEGL